MSGPEKVPSAEGHMSAEGTFSGPQVQSSGASPLTNRRKFTPCCILPGMGARKTFSQFDFFTFC
jgi:hypothetical protein